MAQHGAARVVGLDIRENVLEKAKQAAETVGLSSKCSFCQETKTKADVVVSLDSFEHFQDPNRVLCQMAGLLQPGGAVWISWGHPWYHPLGGHTFSIFPWAHLIFTESRADQVAVYLQE